MKKSVRSISGLLALSLVLGIILTLPSESLAASKMYLDKKEYLPYEQMKIKITPDFKEGYNDAHDWALIKGPNGYFSEKEDLESENIIFSLRKDFENKNYDAFKGLEHLKELVIDDNYIGHFKFAGSPFKGEMILNAPLKGGNYEVVLFPMGEGNTKNMVSVKFKVKETNNKFANNNKVENVVKLFIDDKEIKSDVAPMLRENRTFVPLRVISENLGYEVKWNQEDWTATLTKGKQIVKITIGDYRIKVNNDGKLSEVKIDIPAQIINSRTMLPLRAIAEISGAEVEWDNANWQVFIKTK